MTLRFAFALLLLGSGIALAGAPSSTDEARALAGQSSTSAPVREHPSRMPQSTPGTTDEARSPRGAHHHAGADCPRPCRCG